MYQRLRTAKEEWDATWTELVKEHLPDLPMDELRSAWDEQPGIRGNLASWLLERGDPLIDLDRYYQCLNLQDVSLSTKAAHRIGKPESISLAQAELLVTALLRHQGNKELRQALVTLLDADSVENALELAREKYPDSAVIARLGGSQDMQAFPRSAHHDRLEVRQLTKRERGLRPPGLRGLSRRKQPSRSNFAGSFGPLRKRRFFSSHLQSKPGHLGTVSSPGISNQGREKFRRYPRILVTRSNPARAEQRPGSESVGQRNPLQGKHSVFPDAGRSSSSGRAIGTSRTCGPMFKICRDRPLVPVYFLVGTICLLKKTRRSVGAEPGFKMFPIHPRPTIEQSTCTEAKRPRRPAAFQVLERFAAIYGRPLRVGLIKIPGMFVVRNVLTNREQGHPGIARQGRLAHDRIERSNPLQRCRDFPGILPSHTRDPWWQVPREDQNDTSRVPPGSRSNRKCESPHRDRPPRVGPTPCILPGKFPVVSAPEPAAGPVRDSSDKQPGCSPGDERHVSSCTFRRPHPNPDQNQDPFAQQSSYSVPDSIHGLALAFHRENRFLPK